jgi:hypothetical protein
MGGESGAEGLEVEGVDGLDEGVDDGVRGGERGVRGGLLSPLDFDLTLPEEESLEEEEGPGVEESSGESARGVGCLWLLATLFGCRGTAAPGGEETCEGGLGVAWEVVGVRRVMVGFCCDESVGVRRVMVGVLGGWEVGVLGVKIAV